MKQAPIIDRKCAEPSFASSSLSAIGVLYALTIRQHLHGRAGW